MRIGLVTPFFYPHPGGISEHVYFLYKNFKNLGFSVKIICPKIRKKGVDAPSDLPSEDVIRVGIPLPLLYNGSISYMTVGLPKKAKEVLKTFDFDVLHFHEPLAHPLCWSFLYSSECKNVATFHANKKIGDYSYVKILKFFGSSILDVFDEKLSSLIAVSDAAQKVGQQFFERDFIIVPNGVDVNRFMNAKPLKEFSNSFNILFVGRLEPRKGIKYLIKAFKVFSKIVTDSKLLIVGGGFKAYYKSFVPSELEEKVVFFDYAPFETLPSIYASADLCVFPATRSESFGIVLIEAMAANKPVIATNIDGYNTVTDFGKYAYTVDPENEDQLLKALVELYFLKDKREELSVKGFQRAKEFDWSRISRRISEIYTDQSSASEVC